MRSRAAAAAPAFLAVPATALATPASATSVPSTSGTPPPIVTITATINAQGCPGTMASGGVVSAPGGHPFIVCTGRVRSFDGTALDTDVTIPTGAVKARPLMLLLHGWGGSKTDWESTALERGFHYSCGKDSSGYSYASDSTCSDTKGEKSWTHLVDRRWEHEKPYGVDKQSYVDGLFALGATTAQYSAAGSDPSADLSNWFAGINGASRRARIRTRSSPSSRWAVRSAPRWPVTVLLGDVGHSYADNPSDIWQQAHNETNAWLQSVMARTAPVFPRITVTTAACLTGQSHVTYTASSYGAIAASVVHLDSAAAQSTASSKGPSTGGANTDPIANTGRCSMAASQSDPGQAVYTFPVPTGTLAGAPIAKVDAAIDGTSAEVAARLWEINPGGTQTLITRTVYRIEQAGPTGSSHLAFELWPQAWQFMPGDQVKLELTQNDNPAWRPDNFVSSISFTNLDLGLRLAAA